ncbi:uncharacterized protein LOC126456034 [Schistocerca serialis cubense]|uniref:uncharacterized protein LOC126456034 n=1 Tax=Schistocerca serialis cubense TaxID=2023355 RepID=UPI00214F5D4A|nr:uncharacterized protein LOC126456034 [Schistocerca serialis cubense]
MTVMLLQHSALRHYKLPSPPPPRMTKPAPDASIYCSDYQTRNNNNNNGNKQKRTHHKLSLHPQQQQGCKTTAMRYYRLWIYTCNAVLLVSVLGFAIVAGRIVVADPRRYLVPGLSLYQPSFLYAYLALATQSGLLQLVGCLGALRLNERLLNVYWLLLLVLLFGDAIVGVVWVFRFDKICADLRPTLKQRLAAEYGVDRDFTALWDALQRDYRCCGVDGAQDYAAVANRSAGATVSASAGSTAPTAAATANVTSLGGPTTAATVVGSTTTAAAAPDVGKPEWLWNDHAHRQHDSGGHDIVPESCCRFLGATSERHASTAGSSPMAPDSEMDANRVPIEASQRGATLGPNQKNAHPCGSAPAVPPFRGSGTASATVTGAQPHYHTTGCEARLLLWLRQSADILFVLGYCVIAFLKLCFLGILRYEIREMIQKIKILQGEMRPPPLLLTELGGGASAANNGDLMGGAGGVGGGGGGGGGGAGGGVRQPPDSLQATPLHAAALSHRHLSMLNNDGTDSDTNSNCALIISEDVGAGKPVSSGPRRGCGSNGNNNYEIHELQELNRLLSRHQTQI